jgi:Tfp pilus assembly protein PilZ
MLTTEALRTTSLRKTTPQKPQKRIILSMNMKSKDSNYLNFTNFLKFLKNIQASFATRTAKSITDKVKMLREFRDKMMININQRIENLWTTQSKTKKMRKPEIGEL